MQGKQKPGKPDKTNKQRENKPDPARQEEGLTSPDLDSRQAPDVPEHPTNLEDAGSISAAVAAVLEAQQEERGFPKPEDAGSTPAEDADGARVAGDDPANGDP